MSSSHTHTTSKLPLPRLIFAESNHFDPVTKRILSKLVPRFKDLGYECFFDETVAPTTFDSLLELSQKTADAYKRIKQQAEEKDYDLSDCHVLTLDKNQTEKLKHFIKEVHPSIQDVEIMRYVKDLWDILTAHEIAPATANFLRTLKTYDIPYQGIDLPGTGQRLGHSTLIRRDKN